MNTNSARLLNYMHCRNVNSLWAVGGNANLVTVSHLPREDKRVSGNVRNIKAAIV